MEKKYIILIALALTISTLAIIDYSTGAVEMLIFEHIDYNYTHDVWLPPLSEDTGSIAGYYHIDGKGKNFNFQIMLPGAELFDLHEINGTQVCYDKNGLSGNGTLTHVQVTYDTISALLAKDLKKAMFGTEFSGVYNMTCAAWTGGGNFSNNGKSFDGTFFIVGAATDFEGNFTLSLEGDRIKIVSTYILYPHGQPNSNNIQKVVDKVSYM